MKKTIIHLATCLLTVNIFPVYSQIYTPELLWKLKRISSPALSPDGKTVAYSVRSFDLNENKGNSDISLLNLETGQTVVICGEKSLDESSPQWIENGAAIVYLAPDADGRNQIWYVKKDGTGRKQISNHPTAITNFGFCQNNSVLWFTADVKMLPVFGKEMFDDLPKTTARIYDDLMYRHWNEWDDGERSHIFRATYNNGVIENIIDIMKGEPFDSPMKPMGGAEQIDISPDGKLIAYTCKKLNGAAYATSTNSEIYLYDAVTGKTENLTEGNPGYDTDPKFSPDGKQLLWLSMETPKYEADRNRIFVMDLKTRTKREVTRGFDYSAENARWSNDGLLIYFLCKINATEQLWVHDTRIRSAYPFRQITNDTGDHHAYTFAGAGAKTVMVTSMMSMSMPAELFRIDLNTGNARQITSVNADILAGIKTGKVEKRMIPTTDGKQMLTWVIYPPDFDPQKKYPALLYCQGGPQSTVSQFFSYRWNFQLMAAHGYIVVAPNRRGLPSFGTEWNRQISGDWGGQAMQDLLSAIDDVSREPYVDKNKLGAVGASFGGYSVYWLAGNHQKRFKTFISHCGVFNLTSMYGTTEELFFTDFDLGGPYWENPDNVSYTRFSPHLYVKNWDTPILIIHNEKDFRVPLSQGMEAFTAARLQNLPARFLYFPDEGHWVTKPQNSVLWQRIFFDWLEQYLK
jgi:dipeptidyl aminopeptidase/acylaminoacyl peptidase